MKAKELLEARWKFIIFALLVLLVAGLNVASYQFAKDLLQPALSDPAIPPMFQQRLTSFDAFAWGSWFQTNAPVFLALLAAILGSGLIAGEVSKGTIFFLLSKPVSRERILLTKYAMSMGILLAVSLIASIAIEGVSVILGHPQDIPRLLTATVLVWLGALFTLGLSLLFSVMSTDIMRPLTLALVITLVLSLPAIFPNGENWSLGLYWSSEEAYLNGGFPLKEYGVCLVAAILPVIGALVLFLKKAY
jgi:ABC-2 type transport system permease protein